MDNIKMNTVIQVRRGNSLEWEASSYILKSGEFGLDTETNILKLGNGQDNWETLSSFVTLGTDGKIVSTQLPDPPHFGFLKEKTISSSLPDFVEAPMTTYFKLQDEDLTPNSYVFIYPVDTQTLESFSNTFFNIVKVTEEGKIWLKLAAGAKSPIHILYEIKKVISE